MSVVLRAEEMRTITGAAALEVVMGHEVVKAYLESQIAAAANLVSQGLAFVDGGEFFYLDGRGDVITSQSKPTQKSE